MVDTDADIKVLREELQQLMTQIIRFAVISLTILLLLFLTISHVYEQIHSIDSKIEEAYSLSNITKETPVIPQILLLFHEQLTEPSNEGGEEGPFLEEKVQEAKTRQTQLENELAQVANNVSAQLNVPVNFLGTTLTFNLPEWMLILPFIFLISAAYVSILLTKIRILHKVATQRMSAANSDAVTTLDILLFSRKSNRWPAYARYPLQLQVVIYLLCVIIFLGYLVIIGTPILGQGLLPLFVIIFIQIFASAAFYSFAYAHYVSVRLESQLVSLSDGIPVRNRVTFLWKRLRKAARAIASKLPPKISLPTGSLLVLLTLCLFIAATSSSCNKDKPYEPRRGYELAIRRQGVFWYSATIPQAPFGRYETNYRLHAIGRGLYLLSLTLAVLTLMFSILSLFYVDLRRRQKLFRWAFRLSGLIALFLVADFAFNTPVFSDLFFPLKIIYWLAPIALWWGCAAFKSRRAWTFWLKARAVLIVLYIPLVINAVYFLLLGSLEERSKRGLIVYFLGVHLLSLGYLQLAAGYDPSLKEMRRRKWKIFRRRARHLTYPDNSPVL